MSAGDADNQPGTSQAESYASSPGVRRRMQQQRERDTKPERELRSQLHRMGLRYRVDRRLLPGLTRRVDIVFGPARLAVFVDGCFWHGCPEHGQREHAINGWYWPAKIAGNKARDADTNQRLQDAGWLVIRVWEHEDMHEAAKRIHKAVAGRRRRRPP